MALRLFNGFKHCLAALRSRTTPDEVEQERLRALVLDYPQGHSPSQGHGADLWLPQDAAVAGVPFANDPVWQNKACKTPTTPSRANGAPGTSLPDEIWLRIAHFVAEEQTAEATEALLNMRATSRFFTYIVDWNAPALFAKQVLLRRGQGRLNELPQPARAALFGRLKELSWELTNPQNLAVLQQELPAMHMLQRLEVAGWQQRPDAQLELPNSLQELELFSFRFEDFAGWAATLPPGLARLSLCFGALNGQSQDINLWPQQLGYVRLQACQLTDACELDFSALKRLHTLDLSDNELSETYRLALPQQLERRAVRGLVTL